MINPTLKDIGRKVIYAGAKIEEGKITSFNEKVVFVQYERGAISQATNREDLEYK